MKRHLPNILLLIVVLANVFFMARYISHNGLGLFFSTTGIILLVLGIIIFIFFLSIDPGYGWMRSMDLTRNYIMIFASMAVCMAGVVLLVTGQHMNDLYQQGINEQQRCREIIAGNPVAVMQREWYRARDFQQHDQLQAHLFQEKIDHSKYRILVTADQQHEKHMIRDMVITSPLLASPIAVATDQEECPGVYAADIALDFEQIQQYGGKVYFDLLLTVFEDRELNLGGPRGGETIRFTLQSGRDEGEARPWPPGNARTDASLVNFGHE